MTVRFPRWLLVVVLVGLSITAATAVTLLLTDGRPTWRDRPFDEKSVSEKSVPIVWRGTWKDRWGLMTMSQRGTAVVGDYSYQNGRITGEVDGWVLRGRWRNSKTTGSFRFVMSRDSCTFVGRWQSPEIPGGVKYAGMERLSCKQPRRRNGRVSTL